MIFTQIVTDSTAVAEAADQTISVWELTLDGGPIMIPIGIMFVVAIYLFIERLLTINKANKEPGAFMGKVKELVLRGDVTAARMLCAQQNSPVARMIEKGIARIGSPVKTIEASIENVGKLEIFKLEKNLPTLATIAGAAPMIGFLGTVIGMVQAFIAIAQEEGSVRAKLLSSRIYTAMVTTVIGPSVGIIAYLAYNFLISRVQKVVHKMEYTSIDFIDLLQEPR